MYIYKSKKIDHQTVSVSSLAHVFLYLSPMRFGVQEFDPSSRFFSDHLSRVVVHHNSKNSLPR